MRHPSANEGGAPLAPFRQRRFDELPERPRRSHRFFETESLHVRVEADGWEPVEASVRRRGQGPPLLLLHGLMTSGYSWRYALDPLSEHFTCYLPDLPGAGRTPPVTGSYDPAGLARWVAALVDRLDITGCRAIGNSMGGYLCMQLALDEPRVIGRLVNLHSPGIPLPRLWLLATAMDLPGSRSALRWLIHRDPERWAHRNVHYYDESLKSLEEAREYGQPLATAEGAQSFARYLRETLSPWAMRRFAARLRERREAGEAFPVPLLLVYADRDPMVPPRVGRQLAELVVDARFELITQASHFAHVDATERFLDLALPFLRSRD